MNENNHTNTNISINGSDYINNLKHDKNKLDEFKNHIEHTGKRNISPLILLHLYLSGR
jgi:hypothetical protein